MQTLVVHMREPGRLARDLGARGIAGFYLILGGSVLAALVQPFVLAWLAAAWLWDVPLIPTSETPLLATLAWLHFASLVSGYVVSACVGLLGLQRRGVLSAAIAFVALPLLWLLLSVAAWRALIQLVRKPQLWEKTQHGRARTSRRSEPSFQR
jgi:hypothetical protein